MKHEIVMPDCYTAEEIYSRLKITRQRFSQLCLSGRGPARIWARGHNGGGRYFYPKATADLWIRRRMAVMSFEPVSRKQAAAQIAEFGLAELDAFEAGAAE
jgi:hypothetical protein